VAHNRVHHSFTNIIGADDDIEPGPWLRFHPDPSAPRGFVRFQHLYAWFLYAFTGFAWVFVKDFRQLREQHANRTTIARVVAGKLLHVGVFIALPLALGVGPLALVAGYGVMLATAGVTLAVVFQLAHVVERVTFPERPANGKVSLPWAEHQLRTTADFGRTKIATFFTGALDHQIEHHLFPRICHIHYANLAPIVAACARDHGLPYVHSGSFLAALRSHARTLRALGRPMALAT
jgi:linoleoyl-CoA desaturase